MTPPEEESTSGAPEWLVTYGDMMSLLLTCFVFLFSMCEIRDDQSHAMMNSVRSAFRGKLSLRNVPQTSPLGQLLGAGRLRWIDAMRSSQRAASPSDDDTNAWTAGHPSSTIPMGQIDFAENSAELSPGSQQLLAKLAEQAAGKSYLVEIQANAAGTELPNGSSDPNSWNLAYLRCVNTIDYLVKSGIEPGRVRLSVAGDAKTASSEDIRQMEVSAGRVEVAAIAGPSPAPSPAR